MTCVIGVLSHDTMAIGGDGLGTAADHTVTKRKDKKIFALYDQDGAPMLVGFTTSFRMGQLLTTIVPPSSKREDVFTYMVTRFVPLVQKTFKDGGWTPNSQEDPGTIDGGTFIVLYKNRLFVVYDDFSVEEPVVGYASVGAGAGYAMGAMNVLMQDPVPKTNTGHTLTRHLHRSLVASSAFNGSVGEPFHFLVAHGNDVYSSKPK